MNNATIDPCRRLVDLGAERGCLRALKESMARRLKDMQTGVAAAALADRPPAWTSQEVDDLRHELDEVERLLVANTVAVDMASDELLPVDC